jgi:hypothetical protein
LKTGAGSKTLELACWSMHRSSSKLRDKESRRRACPGTSLMCQPCASRKFCTPERTSALPPKPLDGKERDLHSAIVSCDNKSASTAIACSFTRTTSAVDTGSLRISRSSALACEQLQQVPEVVPAVKDNPMHVLVQYNPRRHEQLPEPLRVNPPLLVALEIDPALL